MPPRSKIFQSEPTRVPGEKNTTFATVSDELESRTKPGVTVNHNGVHPVSH